MKIEIDINEDEIMQLAKDLVVKELAKRIFEYCYEGRVARKVFSDAAKAVLYEPATKKKLMDRAVSQAAAEIRRKAMPFLEDEIKKGVE